MNEAVSALENITKVLEGAAILAGVLVLLVKGSTEDTPKILNLKKKEGRWSSK